MSHQVGHGASLLNKLPAQARRARKRGADKTRRQVERKEVNNQFE